MLGWGQGELQARGIPDGFSAPGSLSHIPPPGGQETGLGARCIPGGDTAGLLSEPESQRAAHALPLSAPWGLVVGTQVDLCRRACGHTA